MEYRAIKSFTINEYSIPGGWYRVEVKDHRGVLIESFTTATMKEGDDQLERLGYKKI